jgi:hypothetical protein
MENMEERQVELWKKFGKYRRKLWQDLKNIEEK